MFARQALAMFPGRLPEIADRGKGLVIGTIAQVQTAEAAPYNRAIITPVGALAGSNLFWW